MITHPARWYSENAAERSLESIARYRISKQTVVLLVTSVAVSGTLIWLLLGPALPHLNTNFTKDDIDRTEAHTPVPVLRKCGDTPEEARVLGCRFELHNFAWVPPECYDDQLGDDWDAQVREFARNSHTPAAEKMISQDLAMRGDMHDAWILWYQHMAHCALIWKKYHRAVALGRPMDSWTYSHAYSEHCADMLINWELSQWRHLFNSHHFLKFPTCGYEWKHQRQEMEERIANRIYQSYENDNGGHVNSISDGEHSDADRHENHSHEHH